jgi:DNA invertase Pin-like site-specific DNA recombinase
MSINGTASLTAADFQNRSATKAPKCYSYIRFSTPEQLKGDSLRRQLELSERYAKDNGLILDDSLKMRDLGISAFKGEHRTKGALGRFQKLVEEGKITKGSTLIVESLDRLSREEVFDALSRFMDIIRAGIKVATLADQMEYTRESINANLGMQLMFSLLTIGRAHEESLMKSKRLGAAWEAKRRNIDKKNLPERARLGCS